MHILMMTIAGKEPRLDINEYATLSTTKLVVHLYKLYNLRWLYCDCCIR